MLVDKEVVTKAVDAPEPAATILEPESKKEPRASSLRMELCSETQFAWNRGKRSILENIFNAFSAFF